jgi:dTDP-4-dehydrorhamnose 3,5-epimerase
MTMKRLETRLEGPILIEPKVLGDERGFFCETYRRNVYAELGIHEEMVQDNHSRSRRGIVRGMHFQIGLGAAKLVRCGRGSIVDVVVDLRRGSPTFGEWEAFELTEDNMRTVYCPVGFAHGFCVTSDIADVMYKQSRYYSDANERGIAYNDPDVNILWPLPESELIPSQRDATAPHLSDIEGDLPFIYQGPRVPAIVHLEPAVVIGARDGGDDFAASPRCGCALPCADRPRIAGGRSRTLNRMESS